MPVDLMFIQMFAIKERFLHYFNNLLVIYKDWSYHYLSMPTCMGIILII